MYSRAASGSLSGTGAQARLACSTHQAPSSGVSPVHAEARGDHADRGAEERPPLVPVIRRPGGALLLADPDRIERRLPRLRVLLLHRVPHVRHDDRHRAARDTARVSWGDSDGFAHRRRRGAYAATPRRVADPRRPPRDLPQHLPADHGGGRRRPSRRGSFEDPEWVERWDVVLRASSTWTPTTPTWQGTSTGCRGRGGSPSTRRPELPALRHVLLGINAHVNYDLPQALLAVISDDDFADPVLSAAAAATTNASTAVLAGRVAAEDDELQRRADADARPDARPAQPARARSGSCARRG